MGFNESFIEQAKGMTPPKSIDVFFLALQHREAIRRTDTKKGKVKYHAETLNIIQLGEKDSIIMVGNHVYKKVDGDLWRTTKNLTTVEKIESKELIDRYLDYMNHETSSD